MSELIRREEVKKRFLHMYWYRMADLRNAELSIDMIPSVDAVEVVRCKDCKWFVIDDSSIDYGNCLNGGQWYANDYCSYGERSE